MIPVLNGIGVKCAVFGNHDFGKLTVNNNNNNGYLYSANRALSSKRLANRKTKTKTRKIIYSIHRLLHTHTHIHSTTTRTRAHVKAHRYPWQ